MLLTLISLSVIAPRIQQIPCNSEQEQKKRTSNIYFWLFLEEQLGTFLNWSVIFFHVFIYNQASARLTANRADHCPDFFFKKYFLRYFFLFFFCQTIITLSRSRKRGWKAKRNEKAVVGIALSRKKDSLLRVNRASLFCLPDQNRYSTNFEFVFLWEREGERERQQCFTWEFDTIWRLVREMLFSSSEPSCPYGTQRVQQRSQWHQVTGGGQKAQRIHLPDSEQHRGTLSICAVCVSTRAAS